MLSIEAKRAQHFLAMVLIGDGIMALVHPKHDAHAWKTGPRAWRRLMQALAERPALTRTIGLAQVAGGIAWALSQNREGTATLRGSSSRGGLRRILRQLR